MSRNYALNTEAAKQAEKMGNRITETGKYVGVITSAEAIKSKKGTDGIELSFKSDEGQTADYLTMWTYNVDGKELYGFKTLNALMTCVEAKTLTPKQSKLEKYIDGGKKTVDATIFPELTGKRIGLLLQREEYQKNDGTIGNKMAIFVPFEATTERTAKEKLEKAVTGVSLTHLVSMLKDRPMQAQAVNANNPGNYGAPAGDFDDDIGF